MFSYEGQSVARCPGWNARDAGWEMSHPSFRDIVPSSSAVITVCLYLHKGQLAPSGPPSQLLATTHLLSLLCDVCLPLCDLVWLAAFMHVCFWTHPCTPFCEENSSAIPQWAGTGLFSPLATGAFIPFLHRCNFNSWSGITGHMGVLLLTKPLCHFTVLLLTWLSCQLLLFFSF